MLDFVALEEKLQTENESLKSAIVAVKKELQTEKDSIFVETKSGSIRKLYYTLLANQVPAALPQESAARIRDIVSTVLECFFLDCDISSVKLPKHTYCVNKSKVESSHSI